MISNSALSNLSITYVNDVCIIITGKSAKENIKKLTEVHEQAALWKKRHASVFNVKKYKLVHFERSYSLATLIFPELAEFIEFSETVTYLGIMFDWNLSWDGQLKQIKNKTMIRLAAISSLTGSICGIGIKELRHIYFACILPLATHEFTAWLPDQTSGSGQVIQYNKIIGKMKELQKKAGKAIFGGSTRIAAKAYNTELDLMPIDLQLEMTIMKTVLRIMTQPTFKNLNTPLHFKRPFARWIVKIKEQSGKPIESLKFKKPYIYAP